MDDAMQTTLQCSTCNQPIDATDKFCRHCGRRQRAGAPWYFQPVWIALLAFFFLGPFALALVWRAPGLGRLTKNILAIGIVLYSLVAIYFSFQAGIVLLELIGEISQELDELNF